MQHSSSSTTGPAASTSQIQSTSTVVGQPSNAVNQQQLQQSQDDPTFGPLERAGKVVDERLARDERWTGVGDSLGGAASSDYVLPPNPAWAPFQKTRTVLLPDRLFEEHDLSQSRCTMGLLPEIERSWVTVDHRLLLWDWADGSSFTTFEELTDVIVGVGLVKPRPGVFVDSISHLLVLTTPTQITLVGLGFASPTPGAKREITFYLTGLSVPTDGVSLTTIRGTASGRIFLASSPDALTPGGIGGDGCLYELVYQSAEGWFVKRCTLYNLSSGSLGRSVVPSFLRGLSAIATSEWIISIEVDDERGLLYALLRNGTIEMHQLPSSAPGAGFDGPPKLMAKSSDIFRQALTILPGSPMLNARNFKIVSMVVISQKEGGNNKIGLVAITNTGVRLYFTHQRRGYANYYNVSSQAAALELCHVRPPPAPAAVPPPLQNGYYGQQVAPPAPAPASTIAFNAIIQATYASGGLLLAANNLTADIDVLLVAAPDVAAAARSSAEAASGTNASGAAARQLSEVAGTIEIPGRTWDMVEITKKAVSGVTGGTALNELATQVTQPRREWVVLTNMGANVVVRQRPVDTLLEVLEAAGTNGSGGHGEIGVFFESYGRDQSCAMLLTIAAGNSRLAIGESTASYAAGANGFNHGSRTASSSVTESAKSLFFEGGGRPVSIDRGGYGSVPQGTVSDTKIVYSGRHEGLAFYFARLIRPIWKQKITKLSPTPENPNRQETQVSDPVLASVQRDLVSLRAFVEQEQQMFTALPDSGRSAQVATAYQAEQASLNSLRLLLTQSVEAISFILLLIDYKISDIIASCVSELQRSLLGLTYQDLLTTKVGRDAARSLVSAVIDQQIGRQLSVDAISDTLQQRCGSFCSADDVLLYKAIEAIRRAKDTHENAERLENLRESLRLFIKATKHLSFERLTEVCAEYNAMRYPLGVIDLALNCAHEWDGTDRAVSYWLDGMPPNDARSLAFELRKKCNELVFATLQASDEFLNEAAQPNRLSLHDQSRAAISYEEADGLRTNAYNKALSVKDEFFHFALYDWYLSRGMTDQLLETRTPYLESYLSNEPTTLEKSDLLWQYFVRTSRYSSAASILAVLAETPSFPLSIDKRVEYLSLAVGNAKSQFPSSRSDTVQFLTDVEEKLEVAQVQIEIYRAIEELDMSPEEKTRWLEKVEERLYTISELYSEFAEPLALLEIVLLIFHVSDHRDEFLVSATWDAILARAHDQTTDRRFEAVSAKVIELGRRFHTSDIAFPLPTLATMLETYSYDNRADVRPGWVPIAFHEGGVPWESIFAAFDELFTAKVPPWHNNAALVFLATDITTLLEAWLAEAGSSHTSSSYASTSPFPATEVDTAVGKYLMVLNSAGGAGTVVARLQEMQRAIRRRF